MTLPNVSDFAFETVLNDMYAHPMTSMRATARRTGIGYRTVANVVQYMVMEGSLVRRRIGKGAGSGYASTYANFVRPSIF
jgi:DNA-binding transcriptional regulator YhcF (GntR family)